ncbi:hypothetical protein BGZ93_009434 [Podila epicladia]|nr:hypothetical protein BGZ92_003048 [Podila epicladia]KAG0099037.1 hypothetical protein BGZ93_009434 [Podila epicladia]
MEPSSPTISSASSASSPAPPYLDYIAHPHEMTDITIETKVDPHDETTTTTTIIHQPFLIARECPAPRIISWMKGPSNKTISRKKKAQQKHRQHRSRTNNNRLRQIVPFLSPSKPGGASETKPAGQITVFSIQVTVLGKVLVPSTGPADPLPEDLAGSKKVPAQLVRSETTSYVIHRTFEDFHHLSDMVLALQASHNHYHLRHHHQSPQEHHHFSPLRINHPHPGLYQALLKRLPFSNARANQRAFDASSTTHGFDEEGAFERVLEMDQYLEDVWQLLTASANSEQLTPEQHNILQWLKPLPNSTHADGRQMKNRKTETATKTQATVSPSSAGSVKVRQDQDQASALLSPVLPSTSSSVLSSPSMSSPSELMPIEELYRESAPVHKSASAASLPSLCSSLSFENGDHGHHLGEKNATPSEGSLPATPDGHHESPRRIGNSIEGDDERGYGLSDPPTLRSESTSRRHTVIDALQGGDDDMAATKDKRRISLSQVIKSLATVSFHLDPEQRKRDPTSASLSSPPSPANGWAEEDLYIWNTVTTKNAPRAGATL